MRKIPLTQGKSALVDDADYEWLSKWKWHAHKDKNGVLFYAERRDKSRTPRIVKMHREILKTPGYLVVDHKNRNGLDNRRQNIHNCTVAVNNQLCKKRLAKKSNKRKSKLTGQLARLD
ncbi:MAG: hypothetical protein E6Q35_02320 [Chryseobacterium cucumeris]|nr:MAG: hypothetical protein E6Q35_02320 [Chryseobacterium cucumeris]